MGDRPLIVHIARDVTERKRAEKRLQLAATVFENTSEGIMITDSAGRLQSTNPSFTAITGFAADEVIGQNPRILQSGMQSREFYQQMWDSIAQTGQWQGEIINRRKNGEAYTQWLNINAVKDVSGNVTHYVGVTFDISELKASERMKDEFIASVSHELRTPLTSIHGSLGLLDSGVASVSPEKSAELIRIAKGNSQRLLRLIDDILGIAKIESEKMKFHLRSVNVAGLVTSAVEANQDYAKQFGVQIDVEPGPANARVLGDKDRLMQVLANLLSNAVKHSPEGGTIEVTTVSNDGYWRICVTDHGPGIPESFRSEVFKKFAQADATDRRRRGGTGLGLSISKAIIDRLGGRIGFDSEPGVAHVLLLRVTEDAAALDDRSRRRAYRGQLRPAGIGGVTAVPAGTLQRILYVEDDADIRKIVSMSLEMVGEYTVTACGSCADALQVVDDFAPDLLLLDVMMPEMDGPSTLRHLRKRESAMNAPAVFITAKVNAADMAQYRKLGVLDVIVKPFDPMALPDRVAKIWQHHRSGL